MQRYIRNSKLQFYIPIIALVQFSPIHSENKLGVIQKFVGSEIQAKDRNIL